MQNIVGFVARIRAWGGRDMCSIEVGVGGRVVKGGVCRCVAGIREGRKEVCQRLISNDPIGIRRPAPLLDLPSRPCFSIDVQVMLK